MFNSADWKKLIFIALSAVIFLTGIAMGMGGRPGIPQISISGQEGVLSPVMLGVGSVFMKIENSGSGDDTLVSARSDIEGGYVELHDVKEGRMVKMEKIAVPSKSVVELKPRSLHIMVFKLPKDIKEGHEIKLYLMFEKSGEKQVPLKLMKAPGADTHRHH